MISRAAQLPSIHTKKSVVPNSLIYYGTAARKRGRNHKQVVFLLFIIL